MYTPGPLSTFGPAILDKDGNILGEACYLVNLEGGKETWADAEANARLWSLSPNMFALLEENDGM